jgi:hypothetical protein
MAPQTRTLDLPKSSARLGPTPRRFALVMSDTTAMAAEPTASTVAPQPTSAATETSCVPAKAPHVAIEAAGSSS